MIMGGNRETKKFIRKKSKTEISLQTLKDNREQKQLYIYNFEKLHETSLKNTNYCNSAKTDYLNRIQ